MEKFYNRLMRPLLLVLLAASTAFAQTSISGTVKDDAGESIPGANIVVVGLVAGTTTNSSGQFNLKVSQAPPLKIQISFIGYKTQEIEITDANTANLDIMIESATNQLAEVVVTGGSRAPESFMKAAGTIELVDLVAIRQTAAPDFFDALANVKGVSVNSGSLNFTQVNTRGFATIANVRFVQLVDGMDTSAPLLNFPTGNIVGMSELDAESMELIPGAASALYGPNAFNGILIMKSKSPFEYQGLSAQFKGGITKSDAQGGSSNPLYNFGFRYAKAFNNKFAFKVNFSMLDATDWIGNDYKTDRNNPESPIDLSGAANFDGLNLYGDETPIPVPIPLFGPLDLRRTGFKEEAILDNNDAKSLKYDVALHYRITDNMEILYNYRFGGGSSIYQGTEKYALRDFKQSFHKVELKSKNYFVRAYMTETKDGDSWNMSAQGAYMNEYYSPTIAQWAPEYAQRYVLSLQGFIPGVPAGDQAAAHAAARAYADRNRPIEGTAAYDQLVKDVRKNLFQRNPPGSSFVDNSRLYHAEFNYNFAKVEFAEIMVGGNFRSYSLFSEGTVFNEAADKDFSGPGFIPEAADFERININEYGVYTQISKNISEAFRLTGSIRYDKNENFDGRVTPRLSAVYTVNENHNFRASFQTGFRNPDTQAQFIYFPSSGGTLLGSTKANAERYGVHNGGAWSQASYNAFRASGGSLDPVTGAPIGGTSSLLVTSDIPYIKPEQLKSVEIGYKGLIANDLLIDLNYYYTKYTDFIGGEIVAVKVGTTHQGNAVAAGTLYSPYVNKGEDVTSSGVGLGVTYNLPKNFTLSANYNRATFETNAAPNSEFRAGFNTPENKVNIGLGNRKVTKNLGFNINYRWQEGFLWESSYGTWNVPEFGVVDAQINYRISSIKTVAKIGGTNILGGDYRTNFGAPFVGQQFYVSLTFDEFFK